uniref:Nuclear receptor domain-containing protein n=1 Tax=Caenorhabditis tropicalis TaxID=1561998 RepID=A0A1I7UVM0_9PELO
MNYTNSPCSSSPVSTTVLPSKCMVCDRPSHGFHCDVATCKGCKTFFRRMFLSDKTQIKCDGNRDCYDLTIRTVPGLSEIAQVLLDNERRQYSQILFDFCLRKQRDGPSRYVELISILGIIEKQQWQLRDFYIVQMRPVLELSPEEHRIKLIDEVFS